MPQTQPPRLKSRAEQGVLILTVTEAELRGDALVRALQHQLLAALAQAGPSPRVVLDLHLVRTLASEGFRPLIILRRKLLEAGGRLVLCRLSPVVAQVFASTRLISASRNPDAFEVHPDVAAALASLSDPPVGPWPVGTQRHTSACNPAPQP
jgi:anti-anti-sigma factor